MSLQDLTLTQRQLDILKVLLEKADGQRGGHAEQSLLSLVSPQELLTLETQLMPGAYAWPLPTEKQELGSWP